MLALSTPLAAQTALPPVEVDAPKSTPAHVVRRPHRPTRRPVVAKARPATVPPVAAAPAPASAAAAALPGPTGPLAPTPNFLSQTQALDAARMDIQPRIGANAYDLGRAAISQQPQGDNAPIEKVLLQLPGVVQDSAASGDFHIRNEHANVQYRINGVLLPDGVSGFGQLIDTSFIGTLSLLDGVLPAQYGLRTAGLIDIQTRSGAFDNGGSISFYGGSHTTLQPRLTYGGTVGDTQFFATGTFNTNNVGIENPTSSTDAIHDLTRQGRFFGYVSTLLDNQTCVSFITGLSINGYQIPNSPGQPPQFTAFGVSNFDSSLLNENQVERNLYNVLAVQRTVGNIDGQLAFFSRYSTLHFVPDPIGDLVFNGISSNVIRDSLLNGVQGDGAIHLGMHRVRFGFQVSGERTTAASSNTVLPLDMSGNPVDAPFNVGDSSTKLGWLGSLYAQDEWKLTSQLTLNAGLRFDQMDQYVTANQVSTRIALVYQPFEGTTLHAGFARYFTPPPQALSAPTNLAAFANTTGAPGVTQDDAVRPERSSYFDAGITQKLLPGLEGGVDAYYKRATNLIDDGQFGQALVLTAFNYAKAYNSGVEFKLNYQDVNWHAYANLALARQRATQVSSNQYLFDPDELAYIASHYIYSDHDQAVTASGGVSYTFDGTTVSTDVIYGSGLRDGFANIGTVSPYAQVNLGLSHAFDLRTFPGAGPLTVRFDVVNLLDHTYEIRDGSGIGVFAPQYGPRRSFFAGVSQKF